MSADDEEALWLEIATDRPAAEMPCGTVLPWPLCHGLKVVVAKYGIPSPIHAVTFDGDTVNVALEDGQRGKIDDLFFEINHPELLQTLSSSSLLFEEDDPRQRVWAETILSAWAYRAAEYREPGEL